MNYTLLKQELTDDPLTRGYANMLDIAAANDLNTEYRTFQRNSISGEDLARLSDGTDLQALSARPFDLWRSYLGLDTISLEEGSETRDILAALFPQGSTTRANILAFISENVPQSRAAELGLGFVDWRDVRRAREI